MKIFQLVDDFLNKITMYRLTLYCTAVLWLVALIFSITGILHYNPINLVLSLICLFIVCIATNELFAYIFKAPSNKESTYITIFILASIISPFGSVNDLLFLFLAGLIAVASKYVLAINNKHAFNPAAMGVVLAAVITNQSATWWMGTICMAPFVLASGILISRKIKRTDLFLSFIISSFIFAMGYGVFEGQKLLSTINAVIFNSPMLYLGSIMLTEPMTTPPSKNMSIAYGFLVGFLNAPFVGLGGYYSTPEIAIVLGNIFSYFVSPKYKLILKLKEKATIANNTYDFIFNSDQKLKFKAGQYLEWTLPHKRIDNRGMRRYFTIASSPTEKDVIIGVKFYDNPSSYKKSLISLKPGEKVVASQLSGDFVLPEDKNKKLIFIAGGIGVTPFRSMIKYLIDNNEKRDIIIFYSNKDFADIAYKQTFDQVENKLGIKTVYSLSNINSVPQDWSGEKGFVDKIMIEKWAPDFKDRIFYISGPRSMIVTFEKVLRESGVSKNHIKTDFFPGFA